MDCQNCTRAGAALCSLTAPSREALASPAASPHLSVPVCLPARLFLWILLSASLCSACWVPALPSAPETVAVCPPLLRGLGAASAPPSSPQLASLWGSLRMSARPSQSWPAALGTSGRTGASGRGACTPACPHPHLLPRHPSPPPRLTCPGRADRKEKPRVRPTWGVGCGKQTGAGSGRGLLPTPASPPPHTFASF